MAKLNKELHEALENVDGKEFTRGTTLAKTLQNFNSIHIVSVVTFTKTTDGSEIVVKDLNGDVVAPEQNGTYNLHEETYAVINSKAGYFSKTTEITIEQADITAGTKSVTLAALEKYCVVTFAPKDSVSSEAITGATIIVKKGEDVVVAEANGTYKLVANSYTYDISATGYVPQAAVALTVESGDVSTGTKTIAPELVASAE